MWDCWYGAEFWYCEPYIPMPNVIGEDCECVPGAQRYCDVPTYCNWGVQACTDDGLGWGECIEVNSPPPECDFGHPFYEIESERCCIENGYCCQDFWDIDGDRNNQESLGNCEDVIVCPQPIG